MNAACQLCNCYPCRCAHRPAVLLERIRDAQAVAHRRAELLKVNGDPRQTLFVDLAALLSEVEGRLSESMKAGDA